MEPPDAPVLGIGLDVALEVHVVALLDVVRVQGCAELQRDDGWVCKTRQALVMWSGARGEGRGARGEGRGARGEARLSILTCSLLLSTQRDREVEQTDEI